MLRLAPVGTATASLMPTMSTFPTSPTTRSGMTRLPATGQTIPKCPRDYTNQGGVCLSQGCLDGKSKCIVQDILGNTCTFDQMLVYQGATGIKRCPAPGSVVPEESGQFINPSAPGSVPIPGTLPMPPNGSQPPPTGLPPQSTNPGVTITPQGAVVMEVLPGYTLIFGRLVPKWALWGGAIAVGAGLFFGFRRHHAR